MQWYPYEELSIQAGDQANNLLLSLPWMSLELEHEPGSDLNFERVLAAFLPSNAGKGSIKEIADNNTASQFLSRLSDFPVAYAMPQATRTPSKQEPNNSRSKYFSSPVSTLKMVLNASKLFKIEAPELYKFISMMPEYWQWNSEDLLAKSRITNTDDYDPTSLYCALLRQRLLSEMAQDSSGVFPVHHRLLETNEASFFSLMCALLSQTLYVTQVCDAALRPALAKWPEIRNDLATFLRQETGHWKLVKASLIQLKDHSPPGNLLLPSTVGAMACLEFSARFNATALCALVGSFEGSAYDDEDPLASLLLRSSRPAAASGLHRHFLINKGEKHSLVGRDWSYRLRAITRSQATEAIRLTELLFHSLSATQKLAMEYTIAERPFTSV